LHSNEASANYLQSQGGEKKVSVVVINAAIKTLPGLG
jgi:hypothetical protein